MHYLEKQDFIIMNQQKRIDEKQAVLDGLMMKIEDVNAVVEEAVDLAYEKACEVVTERVKEEIPDGELAELSVLESFDKDRLKVLIDKVIVYGSDAIEIVWKVGNPFRTETTA